MALLLKGARVVDPAAGLDGIADVLVEGERIADVGEALDAPGAQVVDLAGKVLVPGLIDCHVHFRDPGLEYKEDIETGTRAAARGGFTGVCTMPNTKPVTDNGTVIRYVLSKAAEAGHCRVYPAGAMTKDLKGEILSEMGDMVENGCVAFTDDGRGVQDAGMMRRCMDYGKMFGKVFMSHCQDESLVGAGQVNEGECSTRLGLLGWPAEGEELQIMRDIALARLTGARYHVQHITTKRGLDLVRAAKAEGLPVTCEATPHHMFLNDTMITGAYETALKVNPPLRAPEDAAAVVEGVLDGTVDIIVTDHAPHAAWEKSREFELAPFGMTGLETSLALVNTHLVKTGRLSLARMVELMSINPRRVLSLPALSIAPGNVADISVFDPDLVWTVGADGFESKAENSGYVGQTLTGRATDVLVGGRFTLCAGAVC